MIVLIGLLLIVRDVELMFKSGEKKKCAHTIWSHWKVLRWCFHPASIGQTVLIRLRVHTVKALIIRWRLGH